MPGERCMRGVSCHLCQFLFCLRKPQCHLHGAIERDGASQGGASRPTLAGLCIQGAEATVAVRLEWAHAEFVGQSEGLSVADFGLYDVWRIAMQSNLAQKPQ